MEDYSSNEKVKPEKQILCICFLVSMYVCNVCIYILSYLSSYILFIKICYFILPSSYSWKCLYDRYLPLEEALSLELESYPQ